MIEKRRGSRYYWYRFNWRGKRMRGSTKTANAEAARQIEAAHRLALAKGDVGIVVRGQAPTLAAFSKGFLKHCETQHGKEKTDRFYRQQCRFLAADSRLWNSRLDAINAAAIAAYTRRRRKHVSIASTNRQLATVRRMLRLAAEWGVIAGAPPVKLLAGERPREYVLPRGETELSYLEGLPGAGQRIAVVLLETGLRVGEALKLRRSDVTPPDEETRGLLRVRAENSKSGKSRIVPLTAAAAAALRAAENDGEFVFGNPPPHLSTVEHWHSRVRRGLALPEEFVLHSLRHTALTRLGEAGADAFTIMRIAGHASVVTSQRYVHPVSETLERAIARAETMATKVYTAPSRGRKAKLIVLAKAVKSKS